MRKSEVAARHGKWSSSLSHNMNVDPEHDPPPERHGILWFLDGNVVLQTDTLLFRVHKSVLSLQSSVFKGMFELAGIEDDELNDAARMEMELYEGVPLVVLAGDKGGDVAHLLQTIYEHGCVVMPVRRRCDTDATTFKDTIYPARMTTRSQKSRRSCS